MISSMFLLGILVGRWYAIGVAAIVWPVVLQIKGIDVGWEQVPGAMALAAANAGVGVLVRWGTCILAEDLWIILRDLRSRRHA